MKKSLTLFVAALLVTFTGCKNAKQAEGYKSADTVAVFDTIMVAEEFPMDTIDSNSPKLEVKISLLVPQESDQESLANKNNCITYAAFGYENITPRAAIDSIITSLKENYYSMRDEYINEKDIYPDSPRFTAYYYLKSDARNGKDGIVCYTVNYEAYEGGAHPYHITSVVNFDEKSGKEITLQDVFTENCDSLLTDRLTRRLAEQQGVASLQELQDKGYLYMCDMFITNNFMLDKDSIFFIYNIYEIAPYALGESHIGFKYDELKDLLK